MDIERQRSRSFASGKGFSGSRVRGEGKRKGKQEVKFGHPRNLMTSMNINIICHKHELKIITTRLEMEKGDSEAEGRGR